jgi:tRNA (mo5U34)-methyltransferase
MRPHVTARVTPGGAAIDLRERVAAQVWYHTFDLPGGIVTPGYYDLRSLIPKLPLPQSLAGKRCLDVGSADGFLAFELARRGADEVVSLDLDDSSAEDWQGQTREEYQAGGSGRASAAFYLVREALGLDVKRVDMSVYDLDPTHQGHFDYVVMGNLLLHLADPARALRAIATVMKPEAELLSIEPVSLSLTLAHPRRPVAQLCPVDEPQWWTLNLRANARMMYAAGFEIVERRWPLRVAFGPTFPRLPRSWRSKAGWSWGSTLNFWLVTRQFGLPTAAVRVQVKDTPGHMS